MQTYTSPAVQTGDNPINCQKNADKDPPRARRRRRGNIRISSHGSVWGMTTAMISPRISPSQSPGESSPGPDVILPGMRNRRRSISRTPRAMSGEEIHKLTNLMRFITNNHSERVTLLQIAMTPFEVCYRSHNSLANNALAGWALTILFVIICHIRRPGQKVKKTPCVTLFTND